MRQRLAERKQSHLEPAEKKRQAKHDQEGADKKVSKMGQRLAQHDQLEESDHEYDGRQIAHAFENRIEEGPEARFHPDPCLLLTLRESLSRV